MLFVMFQVRQATPGINPQVSIFSTWEQDQFFRVFPLFKIWITESPEIFKQIIADLFVITGKDH